MYPYNVCICMGRFQPFHLGHLSLVQTALAQGERVIILLGSHLQSRNSKNPWTAEEREQMIRLCLSLDEQRRIQVIPISDYQTNEEWAVNIHQAVKTVTQPQETIAIAGHHAEGVAFFSRWFPNLTYIEKLRQPDLNATDIRAAYFNGALESDYAHKLPAGTLHYLRAFKAQVLDSTRIFIEDHPNGFQN